jgi:hypothetical protein
MTMEMKDKFVMAANRGYDGPSIERTNSHVGLGSIAMNSAGRGRKEARSESVTRLQDAVRKKRKDSRGPGSDNGWGSNGGEHDGNGGNGGNGGGAGLSEMASPPPRPPSRPQSRTGRPPHYGQSARGQSVAAVAGDHSGGSGDGSGGDEGDPRFYYAGYHTVASPYHGGYGSPASVALEGRLNLLTQRVEDLAQAHMRTAQSATTTGGDNITGSMNTLVQSQMLLMAKLDAAAAKRRGEGAEGRTLPPLLVAALGGAMVALLAMRMADFSRK